jgi:hypothetical protein
MSGYRLVTPTAFALTSGEKTILNAIAPAGFGLKLVEFGISFDGVTASAVPARVSIHRSTQATAGTSGVSPTVTQVRGRDTGSSDPTGGSNYTVEPSVYTEVASYYVPAFMGLLVVQFPLGREIEVDSSAGTDEAIAITVNVPAAVNGLCYMDVEPLG